MDSDLEFAKLTGVSENIREHVRSLKWLLSILVFIFVLFVGCTGILGYVIIERMHEPLVVTVSPTNPLFSVIHGFGDGRIRMVSVDDKGRLITVQATEADRSPAKPECGQFEIRKEVSSGGK